MKKCFLMSLTIIFIILLTGCNPTFNEGTSGSETPSESQSESQVTDDKVTNIEIVKHGLDTAEERIYEDDEYIVSFPVQGNRGVVTYADGRQEDLHDAIEAGRVTIAEIVKYIEAYCYVQHKGDIYAVFDYAKGNGINVQKRQELFYEDEKHEYYFPEVRSEYIFIKYKDGTEENVKLALVNGKVTFDNLTFLGLDYVVKDKTDVSISSEKRLITIINWVEVNDLGTDSAEELFFEDEKYEYRFSSIQSRAIEAYFSDGTSENVADALAAGYITIDDLVRYNIEFYTYEKK